ncbi:ABC transporter substrate-binding protein [Phocea massiliensis]|uniref:Corrinoid ABC transporter substrate-binding protein n=1 Tax=uncultured Anaerotruncus sp. TaxID=905011 RepID=A0A6N2URV9_9FIRM|nr:ABC transporter substrate-binding protein [Merdimmobilis hominis]MCD4837255.1 ABC transporter substrate-binding protein [Merdimmobilis hominis]
MIKKWIALCLGALLLVAVFSGCGTGETPSGSQGSSPQGEPAAEGEIVTREDGSISFTDLSGRAITLEKQPETIAVANYLVNFMLVGGSQSLDKVSALAIDGWQDTRYGEYTVFTESFPKLLELPSVGGYHNDVLDAEKVLALAPDVLLINTSQYTENEASIPTWEAAGIQVVTVDYHKMSLENHLRSTRILGALLGRQEVAEELCRRYQGGIDLVNERLSTLSPEEKAAKVYVELGNNGAGEYGNSYAGTLWGGILDNLGVINLANGRLEGAYGVLDREYVISSNPDYIFIGGAIWSGDTGGDQMRMGFTIDEALAQERLRGFAGREEWRGLTAVQNGDVYGVDHGSLRNIADYVFTEYMAKCIYPDLFADLDPEAEMHDLYATYLPELRYTGTFMIQWDRQ